MKRLLIFLLLPLIMYQIKGQNFQINWQNCFGGSDNDEAFDIVENADGGYMIMGFTYSTDGDISYNHGYNDVWLVKTDSVGNMLWERTYGGSNGDIGYCMLKVHNNAYYILAVSQSFDGDVSYDPYPNSSDYWIIKIDSSGNIIWDRIYGGSWYDNPLNGIVTDDGGIVAFGFTGSDDGDVSEFFGFYDWWMLKLDSLGNKQWDRSFGATKSDYGKTIIQTSDGGYLIGGDVYKIDGGNIECNNFHFKDAVLIKLDSAGNIEWQQCYGGSESDVGGGLLEILDGYMFLASTMSDDGDVTGFHGLAGLSADIWLIKVDFSGNLVWQKCYGGTEWEYAKKIFPTGDGGYHIIGQTSSQDGDVSGNHSISEYAYDIWLLRIDSVGNLLEQQCFGGTGSERVNLGVIKKSDHRFVIAANTQGGPSYDVQCDFSNGGDTRYWVFEISDSTVGLPEIAQSVDEILVYPNPAREAVIIEWPQQLTVHEIHIYDTYGRVMEIVQLPKENTRYTWQCTSFPEGLYFVMVQTDEGRIGRRVVVRR